MSGSPSPRPTEPDLLGWELYLTRLESWARQVGDPAAAAVDPAGGDQPPHQPSAPEPPSEGPLPAALRSQAESVLTSLTHASERAQAARLDVVRQLNALRQVPPRDSGEARYLDTTG